MFDYALLASLLMIGVFIMLLPFRHQSWHLKAVISLFFIGFALLAYEQWGGWHAVKKDQNKQMRIQAAQELLKQYKTPDALIEQLKKKISEQPQRARGWYLLGRLYASQGEWSAAQRAFATAVRLKPLNERYAVNDINAIWNANHQQFNDLIRQRLQQLIARNPQQPDALAMLAMDAYQQKHFEQAIQYWQLLLTLTPGDSEAAQALRQAIAKAQGVLKNSSK